MLRSGFYKTSRLGRIFTDKGKKLALIGAENPFTGRMTTSFNEDFDRISEDGHYLITSLDDTTHRI